MNRPIRIKRSFFNFKLNVIVEIRLLAKFDYCTIASREEGVLPSYPGAQILLSRKPGPKTNIADMSFVSYI